MLAQGEMQELMDCFSGAYTIFGLTISVSKTVVMYQPVPGKSFMNPAIFVYGKHFRLVAHFVYLVSQDNSLDREICLRMEKATRSFGLFEKKFWSQCNIKASTKLGVYQACILHAPLYACETWIVYRQHLKALERFH